MFSVLLGLRVLWKLAGLATLVLIVALILSGCGRKGALQAPQSAEQNVQSQTNANAPRDGQTEKPPKQDKKILLDKLLF